MDKDERLRRARQAYENIYESRQYVLSWHGGGESQIYYGIAGFDALTSLLKVTSGTLQNYFSRKKNTHQFKRVNPTTGIEDICTILRIDPPAKQKRPRGRPRKVIDLGRLGSEAAFDMRHTKRRPL